MAVYIPVDSYSEDAFFVRSMGYESNPSSTHWGPGIREYGILHYVTEGKGYFNGHPVGENQGFYIAPSQVHEYHSSQENPWSYFWIVVSQDMAEKYVLPYITMNEEQIFSFPFKQQLTEMIQSKLRKDTILHHIEALAFFFSVISLHEEKPKTSAGMMAYHVENAKTFIENNCHKKITVTDVAEAIHIDDRYLYNLFVRIENTTPKQYIDSQKIFSAKRLLTYTRLPITEVAHAAGFDDVCMFSKFFKKRTGVSPTEYRCKRRTG